MSDSKKALLKTLKEAAADGFLMTADGAPGSRTFFSDALGHTIDGDLDGTHTLDLRHHLANGAQNALLGADTLHFTINGGHNFNLTIKDFNPLLYSPANPPTQVQFAGDPTHDLLEFKFAPSSGVTNLAQAAAAETFTQSGHDVILHIDAAHVHGTITLQGLVDHVPVNQTEFFSWMNQVGNLVEVV